MAGSLPCYSYEKANKISSECSAKGGGGLECLYEVNRAGSTGNDRSSELTVGYFHRFVMYCFA